jgi:hypothetical protein
MNHKVLLALLACLLISFSAWAAAEPVWQSRSTLAPPTSPHIPRGDKGPIAEIPSTSLASDLEAPAQAARPTKTSAPSLKRSSPATSKTLQPRRAHERRPLPGWVGWLALGLGAATLGLQLAVILIGYYTWMFAGGLLLASIATGLLAIIAGSLSIGDRRSKAYGPGIAGLILGIIALLWPFIALIVLILYAY